MRVLASNSAGDEPVSLADMAGLTSRVNTLTNQKIKEIQKITGRMRMLALNAMIESARAGEFGAGFSIVAQEVRGVGGQVEQVASTLEQELVGQVSELERLMQIMAAQARGTRLVDLALNAIEIVDRNLYERTCDVRWWATDSAAVACAAAPEDDAVRKYASERLAVILGAYTVYLDIWLTDLNGRIIANGRPAAYDVIGKDASRESWFRDAMALKSGDGYAVADITAQHLLGDAMTATYSAQICEGGRADGTPLGVIAVHFDWAPQAKAIVEGVRLSKSERERSRVMLVDADHRIIASSDGQGILHEKLALRTDGQASGYFVDLNRCLVAFHATPGYETYRGLGWYGVIVQKD
jgi:Methyl-accepting chemotaxis protein (MCP) signalling domain